MDLMSKIGKFTVDKKFTIFEPKSAIYLSLGLHEERPNYRRSLQPSKENIQHFKLVLLLIISFLCA
jgi:hypothetical protein